MTTTKRGRAGAIRAIPTWNEEQRRERRKRQQEANNVERLGTAERAIEGTREQRRPPKAIKPGVTGVSGEEL
ncbi:hypothetical protein [Halonotius pteroides]|uniref:hypothetical protein n=1 Tax=Halonotius pteroides TaxID=268735 RepID=UPI0010591F09|nr:hypothetical protein [Halonotius pteroides]